MGNIYTNSQLKEKQIRSKSFSAEECQAGRRGGHCSKNDIIESQRLLKEGKDKIQINCLPDQVGKRCPNPAYHHKGNKGKYGESRSHTHIQARSYDIRSQLIKAEECKQGSRQKHCHPQDIIDDDKLLKNDKSTKNLLCLSKHIVGPCHNPKFHKDPKSMSKRQKKLISNNSYKNCVEGKNGYHCQPKDIENYLKQAGKDKDSLNCLPGVIKDKWHDPRQHHDQYFDKYNNKSLIMENLADSFKIEHNKTFYVKQPFLEFKKIQENNKKLLLSNFKEDIIELFQMGSSAISGMPGTAVVDIMMVTKSFPPSEKQIKKFESLGFLVLGKTSHIDNNFWFIKDLNKENTNTKNWELGTVVVHFEEISNINWKHCKYFVDQLNNNKQAFDKQKEIKLVGAIEAKESFNSNDFNEKNKTFSIIKNEKIESSQ